MSYNNWTQKTELRNQAWRDGETQAEYTTVSESVYLTQFRTLDKSSPILPAHRSTLRDKDYSAYSTESSSNSSANVKQSFDQGGSSYSSLSIGSHAFPSNAPNWEYGRSAAEAVLNEHVQLAQNDALRRVRDKSVNLGVNFAELGESMELILNTTKKVTKSYSQLKRGNVMGALSAMGLPEKIPKKCVKTRALHRASKRTNHQGSLGAYVPSAKTVASAWLELEFGWKPMISFMAEAAAAAVYTTERQQPVYRVQGRSGSTGLVYETDGWTSGPSFIWQMRLPYSNPQVYYRIANNYSVSAAVTLKFSVVSPGIDLIQRLGLANPMSLALDVFPLSFLISWMSNFSQCVESLTTWLNKDFVTGCLSTKSTRHSEATPYAIYGIDRPDSQFEVGPTSANELRFDRRFYYTPPDQSLVFKNPISTWKVGTAIALLTQVFSK